VDRAAPDNPPDNPPMLRSTALPPAAAPANGPHMDWNAPRSIHSAVIMCEAAQRHGLPLAQCLENSGITADALERPAAVIRANQELAVARNIERALSSVPGLGLEIGGLFNISAYGVLAFAMSSCATVRELVQLGVHYSSLSFSIAHKRFETVNGEMRVIIEDDHIPAPLRRFLIERDLAAFYNIQFELFSRTLPLARIELRYPKPPWADLYEQRFGVMPTFDAETNLLSASARILDLPLPRANTRALRYWTAELGRLLDERRRLSGLVGEVRSLLLEHPEYLADMTKVAAAFHTTARNLRRRLDAEGSSYRDLVEEFRQTLAEKLLLDSHLSIEQIADRLAYREVASFTRAFRRWSGQSPMQWRQAQKRS
jgi:AraC-like DNA-binding protein